MTERRRSTSGRKTPASDGLSRRAFLGSTSVAPLAASGAAFAAEAEPVFVTVADGVELRWGPRRWMIRKRWFRASGPRVVGESGKTVEIAGRLAGTDGLPAAWRIQLRLVNGAWGMRWGAGGVDLGFVSLNDWFADWPPEFVPGLRLRLDSGFRVGGATFTGRAIMATLRRPFSLYIERSENVRPLGFAIGAPRMSGAVRLLRIEPGESVFSPEATELRGTGSPGCVAILSDVASDRPVWNLGQLPYPTGAAIDLRPASENLTIESSDDARPSVYIREAIGTARLEVRTGSEIQVVHVDDVRYAQKTSDSEFEAVTGAHLWAKVADRATVLAARDFAAQVRGSGPVAMFRDFSVSGRLVFQAELLALHPPGDDGARYDIDFRTGRDLDPSAIGLDAGRGDYQGVPVTVVMGEPLADDPAGNENRIHIGRRSTANVLLNRPGTAEPEADMPVLRVRRPLDGLDLGLTFHDHRLIVEAGRTSLEPGPAARRGVRMHPQHVLEEVFGADPKPALAQVVVDTVRSLLSGSQPSAQETPARDLGSRAPYGAQGGPVTQLARTRVSDSSRIMFGPAAGNRLRLSAGALTDWSGLSLNVTRRAAPDLPVPEQLELINISFDTDRATARGRVKESLTEPAGGETALNLVTGLTFSPDDTAHFRTPHSEPTGETAALWTAQLDLTPTIAGGVAPRSAVRAVWASGFDPGSVFGGGCSPEPTEPFPSTLTYRDRREIMLQSSAYGVAALRSLNLTGQDQPQSRVRYPLKDGKPPAYLGGRPVPVPGTPDVTVMPEGVLSPAAFARFSARLTPYGADLDAEWRGEPAAPLVVDGETRFFSPAFSLESYKHRTSLGSDVFVEVLYKGFLFPYGFRVSLIKVTEREPHPVGDMGPMMPAVRRWFILPKPQSKVFPGIHQPFAGREIPMRRGRLAGGLSPEIVEDFSLPDGLVLPAAPTAPAASADCPAAPRKPDARVFWPRVKASSRGQEPLVYFDVEADDMASPRSLPMLFMDNAAVHEPGVVEAVVRYYNRLTDDLYRTELHHGGRTDFAPGNKLGPDDEQRDETVFETDRLRLAARGRWGSDDAEFFDMDPFMEGADEPPFYPVMLDAQVRIPALDRLVGAPQGLKTVGFNGNYLANGFDARGNPSELYLNFLNPDGFTPLSGRGEVSGGLAQTPTNISGISRKNAIVGGGARVSTSGSSLLAQGQAPIGADDRTPWDLSDVEQGRFNPAKFFKLGKLLGVIDLGEVAKAALIDAQPRLTEVREYAASAEADVRATMSEAATAAAAAIRRALVEAEETLVASLPDAGAKPLDKFYPVLTAELEALATDLEKLGAGPALPDPTSLMRRWTSLKGEIERIAADPTPAVITETLAEIRSAIDTALGAVDVLRASTGLFLNGLLKDAIDGIVDALADELVGAVFGTWPKDMEPVEQRAQVKAVLAGLTPPPAHAVSALLWDSFGRPVADFTTALRRLVALSTDLSSLAEEAPRVVTTAALKALEGAVDIETLVRLAKDGARDLMCRPSTPGGDLRSSPLARIARLAVDVQDTASASKILAELALDMGALRQLQPPETLSGQAVLTAVSGLHVAIERLALEIAISAKACAALSAELNGGIGSGCLLSPEAVSGIGDVLRGQAAVVASLDDVAARVAELEAALPVDLPATGRAALSRIAWGCCALGVDLTAAVINAEVDAAINALPPAILTRLAGPWQDYRSKAAALRAARAALPATLEAQAKDLLNIRAQALALLAVERQLLSKALDFTALSPELTGRIATLLARILGDGLRPVLELHRSVDAVVGKALTEINRSPDVILMLTGPLRDKLGSTKAAIETDINALAAISGSTVPNTAGAAALIRRWRDERPGLVAACETVVEIFSTLAKGQLGAIFDLAAAERAIRDAVSRLLPTRVRLNYQWDTELQSFPAGNPIFVPNPGDLSISTDIVVDLLRPTERQVSVTGMLKAFSINILGSLDLAKLHFTGAEFSIVNGGAPRFTTQIQQVELGDMLSFLDGLGPFMSGKSGFRIEPIFAPMGVKAGYYYATPLIEFGGVKFMNVSLEASVLLPFSDAPAKIRLAVGSRENPTLVSIAPCYAGGGAVSVLATARGIVAFDIQIEFGAATAIQFGPLRGFGRVTTGLYMFAREDGGRLLEGFVHARGEGQVACFGISVNLEVRVTDSGGGQMMGSASYRFRFRVGLVSVGYTVRADYTFKGGKAPPRDAALESKRDAIAPASPPPPDKTGNWSEYRRHFVSTWS